MEFPSQLLYLILEYIDEYNILELWNIQPSNTNLQDLIDIIFNTQCINKHKIMNS